MKTLMWNIVLALAWCAIAGELSARNLLLGFAIAYFALHLPTGEQRGTRYFRKLHRFAAFLLFTATETMKAAFRVAYDVLTRAHHMRPAVLGVPLDARTDAEIALLAGVISLTPGSLSLDVSPDRKTLYVHLMFVDDPATAVARIKDGFERRVLELLR